MFQSVTLNIRAQFPSKGFELMRVHEVRIERVLHLMVRRHWYCIVIVFWKESSEDNERENDGYHRID